MLENEFHFLFECPLYGELRIQYIDCYFYEDPNNIKLRQLFNSTREKQATDLSKIVSEYDQEIPQSQTADNPVAP